MRFFTHFLTYCVCFLITNFYLGFFIRAVAWVEKTVTQYTKEKFLKASKKLFLEVWTWGDWNLLDLWIIKWADMSLPLTPKITKITPNQKHKKDLLHSFTTLRMELRIQIIFPRKVCLTIYVSICFLNYIFRQEIIFVL